MSSQIEICNMALAQVGDESIMSLDELTKPARLCRLFWEPMVKDVLADATWVFARKRVSLPRLADPPAYEFAYAYQLPSDYIRMVRMGEEDDQNDENFVYKVEGQTLVTDEEVANILYIRMIDDPGLFSAKFASCLATRLGAEMAPSLCGVNSGKKEAMLKIYSVIVLDAETIDSQESTPPVHKGGRWVDARE